MRIIVMLLLTLQPSIALADMPPSRTLSFEETAKSFENAPSEMKVEIDRVNKKIRYLDLPKEIIVENHWAPGEQYIQRHFDLQGNLIAEYNFTTGSHWEKLRDPSGVKDILQLMSTACENYATDNRGVYPSSLEDLTGGTYLKVDYCSVGIDDYRIDCTFSTDNYYFKAVPRDAGKDTYTMRTGGILEVLKKE